MEKKAEYTQKANIHATQKQKKGKNLYRHIFVGKWLTLWFWAFAYFKRRKTVEMWHFLVRKRKSGSNKHHTLLTLLHILHATDDFLMLKIQSEAQTKWRKRDVNRSVVRVLLNFSQILDLLSKYIKETSTTKSNLRKWKKNAEKSKSLFLCFYCIELGLEVKISFENFSKFTHIFLQFIKSIDTPQLQDRIYIQKKRGSFEFSFVSESIHFVFYSLFVDYSIDERFFFSTLMNNIHWTWTSFEIRKFNINFAVS